MNTTTKQPKDPQPIQMIEPGFLYQLDAPADEDGSNIWSGGLQPNNGYDAEYLLKATRLFAAAEDMLAALRGLCEVPVPGAARWEAARAAIAKATTP